MFSSSGYFRGIHCPFYASGLCERPYCHFRHTRIEEKPGKQENGPNYSTNVRPYQPTSLQPFPSSSLQTNTIGQKDTTSHSTLASTELTGPVEACQASSVKESQETYPIPSFSEAPKTLPEPHELPVKHDSLPKISGLSKSRIKSPGGSALPAYIPTPKRVQLIVKGTVPLYSPTPKETDSNNKKSSSHTVEYDPVKNFAVRDKASSDTEDDAYHNHSEGILVSESDKAKIILPLQDDTVETVFSNESGGEVAKNKKTSVVEDDLTDSNDDLTDSDEDVSQNYALKPKTEEKLTSYAQLLTPSSYFTSKLNSPVEKRLSVDSNTNTSIKSSEDIKNSNNSSNTSHKHNSSKHSHNSHRSVNSNTSHSLAKSSSTASKVKKVQTSEKGSLSGSSASLEKSHHSSLSSHIQGKHSHKHNSSFKNSSKKPSISYHDKPSLKNKDDPCSLKNSITKSSTNSHLKQSHKDKDVKTSLKDSVEKSSHIKRSNKEKNGKSLLNDCSDKLHNSSKNIERVSISENKKDNIYKSHSSSSSSSSPSKADSHKSGSSRTSHKSESSSNGLSNGHNNHKKEKQVPISVKPHKHKPSDSKLSQPRTDSEIKLKTEKIDGTISEKHNRHISSDSSNSDNHRHQSVSKNGDAAVSRENRNSTNKDKNVEKEAVRSNENNFKQERLDTNVRKSTDDKGAVSSIESCKLVTKRRISDLTANLFGEESEGSGSDSDVQIIEAPPEPAPLVFELSESDNELDNKDEEEDSSMSYPDDFDMLSDNDTFDECLRIFQETERRMAKNAAKSKELGSASDKTRLKMEPKVPEASENLLLSVIKKRMAHKAAREVTRPLKKATAFKPRLSPAEVMHNRIIEMQKRALLRAAKREGRESDLPLKLSDNTSLSNKLLSRSNSSGSSSAPQSSSLSEAASSLLTSQKKREAHIPSVKTPTKTAPNSASSAIWSPNSFYNKKQAEQSKPADPDKNIVTIASTASKTEKRKAHEPTQTNLKRPVIPAEYGDKVPYNVRQRYLNFIIDEYLKFNPEETAFTKGQEEEQVVYNRASNKNIYLRVAVNAITRIRTEAQESQPSSSKKNCTGLASLSSMASSSHPAQSHEATLGGSLAARTSYTLHRSGNTARNLPQTFSGKDLYDQLKKFILTEEQLRQNGYPRPAEDGSNKVKFYKEEETDKMLKDNERTCRRCGKRFYVDKDGDIITVEECVYHYANAYKKKIAGSIDSRYGCCNERIGSKGCQIAKCHVHEKNKTNCLTGYMKTLPASPSSPLNYSVYSLDCEMVYTKLGLELARVTVVADDCSVKYETLVKPDSEIIDYNTRFSGVTEKDMKGVNTTLRGVQAVMLSMICDKTILIGHSLESDLQALKLVHSTVVDTSIVFPHRLGPPYKRALRSLMVDHLQKIIQADDGGHDSKEDAVACMQLMLYKVKSDAKRRF